ncbi:bifunctional DNA-formamidopyrimidine glycosylase/DNA-(apurinic or apyrimidinic site) lyase [Candidatus Saccharibacteria bacterium]|nr:bifunctional DNA-formamidopyrimidine glycosylase/DNA-(apurinic or apyrimidinic site) lyase [Candidatus Saccharibacteria bacterium]
MPELPEVETIKRGLSKIIIEQELQGVEVLCKKSFPCAVAVSGVVTGIRRFGKALVVDLDSGQSLLIHLRMTGQLIYEPRATEVVDIKNKDDGRSEVNEKTEAGGRYAGGHPSDNFVAKLPNKQTRVILHFADGILYFNDQRKFGFIKVLPTTEVEQDSFVRKLAPEPWVMEADEFYEKLQKHKGACIKAVILDQSVVCGLGNIYADEALYSAGIHPERRAGSLSLAEATDLLMCARAVMQASIDSGGSTMATYVKPDGTKGDYLEKFAQVFRREGEVCLRCGGEIEKIRVAGRGTHICPHCQRLTSDVNEASASLSSDFKGLDGDYGKDRRVRD